MKKYMLLALCLILSFSLILTGCVQRYAYTWQIGDEKIGFDYASAEIFTEELNRREHHDLTEEEIGKLSELWQQSLHLVDGDAPLARAAVPQAGSIRFHIGDKGEKLFLYNEPAVEGKHYYVLYLEHAKATVKLYSDEDLVAQTKTILNL